MRIDDGRSGRDNCRSESRVFISSPSICLICVAWVQQRQTKEKKKLSRPSRQAEMGTLLPLHIRRLRLDEKSMTSPFCASQSGWVLRKQTKDQ